jgi:hypothetical protein
MADGADPAEIIVFTFTERAGTWQAWLNDFQDR